MIHFRHTGDFSKLTRFMERAKEAVRLGDLNKYGRAGVAALSSATPVDSGETAASWYYEITNKNNTITISFHNSNIQKWSPHRHPSPIRAWHGDRRLGTGKRLHQPCDPAYF